MKKKLTGIFTAITTPFTEGFALSEPGLRDHIRFQLDHGVDGIVALGTTAEATSLSPQEKEQIIKIIKEETAGKIPVICGTGGYSTDETIQQAELAESLGADYLLSVTPFYLKPSQEGLYRHFSTLAESVETPIILYNNPSRTGQVLDPETTLRLSRIENIVGIKESTADFEALCRTLMLTKEKSPNFSVFAGDDQLAFPLLALGADGLISVATNLIPQEIKQLAQTIRKGQLDKGRELFYRLLPLLKALSIASNPIPIKAAMNLCGLPAGPCRLPLCELDPNQEKILKEALDKTNCALGAKVY